MAHPNGAPERELTGPRAYIDEAAATEFSPSSRAMADRGLARAGP